MPILGVSNQHWIEFFVSKVRKRTARNWARNFAAGLLENQEVMLREYEGLSDEELEIAQEELIKIAEKLKSQVNPDLLP